MAELALKYTIATLLMLALLHWINDTRTQMDRAVLAQFEATVQTVERGTR